MILGRTKPVPPDLDRLFSLPSAAVTLEAAASLTPTWAGAVCFASVEGAALDDIWREVRALLDADPEREAAAGVEAVRDEYGYPVLVSRRRPEELPALVGDPHAVNSPLEDGRVRAALLCSVVGSGRSCCARWWGSGAARARTGCGWGSSICTSAARSIRSRRCRATRAGVTKRWSCGSGRSSRRNCGSSRNLGRWFPLRGAPGL